MIQYQFITYIYKVEYRQCLTGTRMCHESVYEVKYQYNIVVLVVLVV